MIPLCSEAYLRLKLFYQNYQSEDFFQIRLQFYIKPSKIYFHRFWFLIVSNAQPIVGQRPH